MIDQKQKRNGAPRHNGLLCFGVAGISLILGAVLASLFIQPRVEYITSGVIIDTTPTGFMIEVFAMRDIACGEKITTDNVLETAPAQIAIYDKSRVWYPMFPVWQRTDLPIIYESYAKQDIPRGRLIAPEYLIHNPVDNATNNTECLLVTPTQAPIQTPIPQPT